MSLPNYHTHPLPQRYLTSWLLILWFSFTCSCTLFNHRVCFLLVWFGFWLTLVNIIHVWTTSTFVRWGSSMVLSVALPHFENYLAFHYISAIRWIHPVCWWAFNSFHCLPNMSNATVNILACISQCTHIFVQYNSLKFMDPDSHIINFRKQFGITLLMWNTGS